jgi:hypothetical protein
MNLTLPDLNPADESGPDPLEGLLVLEPREMFDRCIIGVVERYQDRFVLYSKTCVLEALHDENDEDSDESALEHYEYNILGGWVGETTPGFLDDV